MEEMEINIYGRESYIKRKPDWMFRYGILLGWLFFILAIGFASVFSFNETIKAPIVLTTTEPPINIRSKRTGRLINIVHSRHDTVQKGDILGVLDHTGNTDAIIGLRNRLGLDYPYANSTEELLERFPWELEVGDHIRPFYNRFLHAYYKLLLHQTLNYDVYEGMELRQRLATNTSTIQNKKQEIQVLERDLELSKIDFDRHNELHKKGVVSARELEIKEIDYLKNLLRSKVWNEQLRQLDLELSSTKNDQLLLTNTSSRNGILHLSNLELEREHLLTELAQWETQYLLESPIDGRVSFYNFWGKYQNVKKDQIVFTVIPIGNPEYLGMCQMPVRNSGKVKVGQRVLLKLENYPYREWGSLEGEVKVISDVPRTGDHKGYMVFIGLNDLKTSFNKKLEFRQEMTGTAEIILDEITLLQRIFYQFREFWSPVTQ